MRFALGSWLSSPSAAAEDLAAGLVHLKVDIIVVAGGNTLIRAAKDATKTIPIVMTGQGADPVQAGFIESLARPGGNVTGLTNLKPRTRREAAGAAQKKPFPNLPVSRFSTIRLIRPVYSS